MGDCIGNLNSGRFTEQASICRQVLLALRQFFLFLVHLRHLKGEYTLACWRGEMQVGYTAIKLLLSTYGDLGYQKFLCQDRLHPIHLIWWDSHSTALSYKSKLYTRLGKFTDTSSIFHVWNKDLEWFALGLSDLPWFVGSWEQGRKVSYLGFCC